MHSARHAISTPIALVAFLFLSTFSEIHAQDRSWHGNATQTSLYFGLKTPDGHKISAQEWSAFLRDVVTPLFPSGLTVVHAYGQSAGTPVDVDADMAANTRILILVRPNTPAATGNVDKIKSAFRLRFPKAGMFHTETAVRVVD